MYLEDGPLVSKWLVKGVTCTAMCRCRLTRSLEDLWSPWVFNHLLNGMILQVVGEILWFVKSPTLWTKSWQLWKKCLQKRGEKTTFHIGKASQEKLRGFVCWWVKEFDLAIHWCFLLTSRTKSSHFNRVSYSYLRLVPGQCVFYLCSWRRWPIWLAWFSIWVGSTTAGGSIPHCYSPVIPNRVMDSITKLFRYLKWRNPHLYKLYVRLM